MKLIITTIAIFILCFSTTAFGQQAKLEGRVFDDKGKPASSVRITAPGGQAAVTDNKGHFIIGFPSSIQPGQAARIEVVKSNWVIYQPMFGDCVTQSTERNYELLQVIIVPKGSPLALSPKRLSQVIAQWTAEIAKLRADVGNLKENQDEDAFLRQYAKEYGFTLEQFRDAAQRWAQIKDSDDKEERALKEYWHKNYIRAAQIATESAQLADEELDQANKKTVEASFKVFRRYKLAGNAYYAQYRFKDALDAYSKIQKRFEMKKLSKEILISEWAEIKLLIGNAKVALGIRVEGEESLRLLNEALADIQQSATFYTREQSPGDWAAMQKSLGNTLRSFGERVSGAESIKYLNDAVQAYRAALEVVTREYLPQMWAGTQNSLANVLLSLGVRVRGVESIKYLNEAVLAYRAALEVSTRKQSPQNWAITHTNLGIVLSRLGERVSGTESIKYLNDAVQAYRAALEVVTREYLPQMWAGTQTNLGNTLRSLGVRVRGVESIKYLNEAIAAHRAALEVRTREQLPQDWGETQTNLGTALWNLGERLQGEESIRYLNDAAAVYRTALEVRTRKHLPQDWAITQNNLGIVLSILGERLQGEESIKYLNDAVMAYRAALEVRTREHFPQDWAITQNAMANTLATLGERLRGEESIKYLNDAVVDYRAILEVVTREQSPQRWAMTQNNLGNALHSLGERIRGEEGVKYLNDAVMAYRAALEVRTREHFPQQWIITQTNLARAYSQLQNWPSAAEAYTNILTLDPNNKEAYGRVAALYHETLFEFDKAFVLHQQWLTRHTGDISAQADFAEAHFTIGSFVECGQRINAVLAMPEVPDSTKIALRAIEIASLLGDSKASQVPVKIDALIAEVTRQPAEFKVIWSFEGTKHFIVQNKKLSPYQAWLGRLFDALARKDRETILLALREVKTKFKR